MTGQLIAPSPYSIAIWKPVHLARARRVAPGKLRLQRRASTIEMRHRAKKPYPRHRLLARGGCRKAGLLLNGPLQHGQR